MWRKPQLMLAATAAIAMLGATAVSASGSVSEVHLALSPSTPAFAACMPHAVVNITVASRRDGNDIMKIHGHGLPPSTTFTTFLLEKAGPPFGAAEYIGDFRSDGAGHVDTQLELIVNEAFSSTIVNGTRVRVDLNQIGAWFADPTADDFCVGPTSPVTPFDGDGAAGLQAFNSATSGPLPAP
jgi:hypothetical protein